MWRQTVGVLAVVGVLVALPSPRLHADEASEEERAQARSHYAAGLRAYNIGDFDLAIREWKAGYRLHGSPDFLFNIAQAYRASRDYDRALFFFNAFLRERPDAPNAAEVRELRDEMERLLQEERSSQDKPPQQPISPSESDVTRDAADDAVPDDRSAPDTPRDDSPDVAAPAPADPQPSSRGRTLRRGGAIAGGGGVALIATGIGFAVAASSAESDLEAAARNREPWSDDLQSKDSRASRNATLATALVATGSAAAVGGGVAYFLGYREDDRRWSLAVSPGWNTRPGINVRVEF